MAEAGAHNDDDDEAARRQAAVVQRLDNEKNMREALNLADKIFKVVSDKEFAEKFKPDIRHKVCIKKYPNFAQAYPLILKYIARNLCYNEKAFKRYLEKISTNPGKGMEGFIERQADYAKFLYIEECYRQGKHVNYKKAQALWNGEHAHMNRWVKRVKEEEKKVKSEFKEKAAENLEIRRQELLDFINGEEEDGEDGGDGGDGGDRSDGGDEEANDLVVMNELTGGDEAERAPISVVASIEQLHARLRGMVELREELVKKCEDADLGQEALGLGEDALYLLQHCAQLSEDLMKSASEIEGKLITIGKWSAQLEQARVIVESAVAEKEKRAREEAAKRDEEQWLRDALAHSIHRRSTTGTKKKSRRGR